MSCVCVVYQRFRFVGDCACVSYHQALEKNQQWLVYDQQREAYVQSVLARSRELEQQLAEAKLQQPETTAADGRKEDGVCVRVVYKVGFTDARQLGRSREGRSAEEPLRAVDFRGAERPGVPKRAGYQKPAGAQRAEGAGERRICLFPKVAIFTFVS